jgi:hypothetical protein
VGPDWVYLINFDGILFRSANSVSDKMKRIDSLGLKKSVSEAVKRTDTSCRALDPSYLQFVRQAEEQEFSTLNAARNGNTICEILKFEALMK